MSLRYLLRCNARVFLLALAAISHPAFSQTASSAISGSVEDPAGASVAKAKITLVDESSGETRASLTNDQGLFTASGLLPGTYTVRVEAPGFSVKALTGVHVPANQQTSAGVIRLEIGATGQQVTVKAAVSEVQTASSERSALLTGQEINQLALKGRDLMDMFRLLPGVVDLGATRDAPSPSNFGNVYINGARSTERAVFMDGVSLNNSGSNNYIQLDPAMDAVAELQIINGSQQAEYGRNGNSTLNIISKSGGRSFHASAAWYFRNDDLNANSFFNNSTGQPRPIYRYNIGNVTAGGPVFIPGKFNVDRNKLFFFFSEQVQRQQISYGTSFVRMPSALERQGDFSQTLDTNGRLIPVIDPQSGTPFPNNVVPQNRVNPSGQAILKFFPLPNYVDPDPTRRLQYNYVSNYASSYPRGEQLYRADYAPSERLNSFVRFVKDEDSLRSPYGTFTGSVNFPSVVQRYNNPAFSLAVHLLKTSSPTLIHDFTFGYTLRSATYDVVDPSLIDRTKVGIQYQPLFQKSGPEQPPYMPSAVFGGVPNAVNGTLGQYPGQTYNPTFSGGYNLSKISGAHNLKFGVYYERTHADIYTYNNWRGLIDFSQSSINPLDSGYAYANAALGNFLSYTESSGRTLGIYTFTNVEYYAQDKWRITPRLTIDYGLRIYHLPTQYDANNNTSAFYPDQYNPAMAPLLLRPGLDAAGKRAAVDPRTGATYPAAYIGAFVPGVGNPANGMVRAGTPGFPRSLHTEPFVLPAPRFGFAYDVTGQGKTAVRGGFGMFYDRVQGNSTINLSGQLPVVSTYQIYYGNLNTISQTSGFLFPPSSVTTVPRHNQIPSTMNFNLGVQHDLGLGTLLDVAYVGNLARHQWGNQNINAIAPGTDFLPQNADATAGRPLPAVFLRPIVGQGTILLEDYSLTQNYNALQVSVTRRFSSRLFFGASWTWSHTLGTLGSDGALETPFFSPRQRDYGPLAYDIRHLFVAHWVYELPGVTRWTRNPLLGGALNHWQLAGSPEFATGTPVTPDFTTTNGADISGSPDITPRIQVVGNPILSRGARTFGQNFNPSAFALPPTGSLGNAGPGILRQPGINNWDLSLFKSFPFGRKEGRYVQFRTEFYNSFNHTQFQTINTSARFSPTGAQVSPQFGAFTAARDPRRIQFALKIAF